MKETSMVLFLGVLAIASSNNPAIASVSVDFCEYYPMSLGNKLTYVDDLGKYYSTEVKGTEIINGEFTYQMQFVHGHDYDYVNLKCEAGIVKVVGFDGVPLQVPIYVDGIDFETSESKVLYSIEPQVVTPAGTFTNVIKIERYGLNEDMGRLYLDQEEYLAKGLGTIKDVNYFVHHSVNPGSYENTYLLVSYDIRLLPEPGQPLVWYWDNDGDGYGAPTISVESVLQPSGYVIDNTDCNDSDSSIHSRATEIRGDGIDQDCNGSDLPPLLTQTQVSQLYVSIFGRASEGEGNNYWRSEQDNMVIAADTMLNTEPAKAYFGTTLNDNQAFIEFIYENTLGKTYAEDPTGVDYWVKELAGGKSKGEVVATLINAAIDPQYAGLRAQDQFLNKVAVSNYTADTVARVPDVNDLSAFVNFISGVTDDSTTVTAAMAAVYGFSGGQDEGWFCQDDDPATDIYRTCNYFPLESGNRWEYTTGSRLALHSDKSCSTGLNGVRYGTDGYTYEPIIQNKELGLATGCQYEMPENEFADFGVNMVLINPEMAIGQTTTHSYFNGNWTFTTTLVGFEQVVVQSGTYNALKYEIVTNDVAKPSSPCSFKTTIWLVKDIGPVKIHRTDAIPSDCKGCMFVCRPDDNYTIVNTPAELIRADISGVTH